MLRIRDTHILETFSIPIIYELHLLSMLTILVLVLCSQMVIKNQIFLIKKRKAINHNKGKVFFSDRLLNSVLVLIYYETDNLPTYLIMQVERSQLTWKNDIYNNNWSDTTESIKPNQDYKKFPQFSLPNVGILKASQIPPSGLFN